MVQRDTGPITRRIVYTCGRKGSPIMYTSQECKRYIRPHSRPPLGSSLRPESSDDPPTVTRARRLKAGVRLSERARIDVDQRPDSEDRLAATRFDERRPVRGLWSRRVGFNVRLDEKSVKEIAPYFPSD